MMSSIVFLDGAEITVRAPCMIELGLHSGDTINQETYHKIVDYNLANLRPAISPSDQSTREGKQ